MGGNREPELARQGDFVCSVSMATVVMKTLRIAFNKGNSPPSGPRRTRTAMARSSAETNGGEFADELLSLARKHWLQEGKKKLPKFNAKVVDQIFHGLSERSFPIKELLLLDQTLYLEK